ncbi:TetR/AcrR family transcriptional regulator [Methanolacinia petrolearia]|uniref:TetR/AcrR family transcriptional regulator n=1 Tax=Methanolacinia petrolearia TaxID=54120 RepID=UPI003BA96328
MNYYILNSTYFGKESASMNGHQKRAIKIENHIKRSALELINTHGPAKVSIDEIARHANVSKVTIYKYFSSKDGLYNEIIKMILDENMESTQTIINSDLTFLEKLKYIIATKSNSVNYMGGEFLQEFIRNDREIEEYIKTNYENKFTELMFNFFEQGKYNGYIDYSLSNDIIYTYIKIFRSGLKERASELELTINDNKSFETLINLFFYGLIMRPE